MIASKVKKCSEHNLYETYSNNYIQHSEQAIGRLHINNDIQNTVKEVVSLLSNMAYYNDND